MTISSLRILKTIIVAGVVGAFLIDLYLVVTASWIFHTATARKLFLWDASNLLGIHAFQRGFETELLGCLLHLIVSIVWAAFFVLVLARIPAIASHPLIWGIIAGVAVKFFMQYIIIPLGRASSPHYNWISLTNNLIAHTLFFGVPVLLIARHAYNAIADRAPVPVC
jgi:uncharacterized membrane protein YagU involved in acid resistance